MRGWCRTFVRGKVMLNKSAMTPLYWLIKTVRRFAENLKNEVAKDLRFHKRTDSKSQPHISKPRQQNSHTIPWANRWPDGITMFISLAEYINLTRRLNCYRQPLRPLWLFHWYNLERLSCQSSNKIDTVVTISVCGITSETFRNPKINAATCMCSK